MQLDYISFNSEITNADKNSSTEKDALRVSFVYHGADIKDINDSTAVLMISVGQYYHEGERFEKTVLKLGQRCKHCLVMVNDTLQKYTLNIDNHHSLDYSYQVALKNGSLWIARNMPALNKMSIPYQIIRWDDWLKDKDYNLRLENVESS